MTDLSWSTNTTVYLGVWTNWSHGSVRGATITMTHRDGTLLTAFLSIFVSFVGTSFWRIASFALHQFLSSEAPNDGLYHQTQAVLRNSGNATIGLTRLLRILWAWRSKASRPFYRTVPLITAIALNIIAFTLASIFSARISSGMSNEVLISSNTCGQKYSGDPNDVNFNTLQNILLSSASKEANRYANYVQSCYTNVSKVDGCGVFVKRQLISTIDRNATCPFESGLCRNKDRNIKLDTGPLRVDSDLGFNVPPDHQYTLRIVHHCALLATEGYKQVYNYSTDTACMRYSYGQMRAHIPVSVPGNFTYEVQIPSEYQLRWKGPDAGMSIYQLGVREAYTHNGSLNRPYSSFEPISELLPTLKDSNLFLIYLMADKVLYTSEVDDDWYAAHQSDINFKFRNSNLQPYRVSGYIADEPGPALACKAQYEVCSAGPSSEQNCTVSGDSTPPNTEGENEFYNTMSWMTGTLMDLGDIIGLLSSSSLTSSNTLNSGLQGPLPNNQWQLEVEYWHNIALASLQGIVAFATGPDDPDVLKYFWVPPATNDQKRLCKSQKIRSSSYSNFSILGIAIILSIGSIIIVLGYTLESLIGLIERRLCKIKYPRLEWSSNHILQTQRIAHEGLGVGTWESCAGAGSIPVTEKNQLLAVLDIQDPKHPQLKILSSAAADDVARTIESISTEVESQVDSGPDSATSANDEQQSPRRDTSRDTRRAEPVTQQRLLSISHPLEAETETIPTNSEIYILDDFYQRGTPSTKENHKQSRSDRDISPRMTDRP